MKKTISSRMQRSLPRSDISLATRQEIKSSVRVELEESTSEASVDMEAESTSTMITAITASESVPSMAGIIRS